MRTQGNTIPASSAMRGGTFILTGYGIRVTVERGHLTISDGYSDVRRRARLHKATCGLRRLLVLGSSGFVTFEALRWLHDIGAAFVQIGEMGEVLLASGPQRLDEARLRRAQALSRSREVGLHITGELLRAKLLGQASVLDALGEVRVASGIRSTTAGLDNVRTFDRMRLIEADCGARYWDALKGVPVRFARRDERLVPEYWKALGPRSSPITNQPRLAASPGQSILNYLYAVLESEAKIACRAVGLDPGMGILHADQAGRDSLALDLMEPVRAKVDAFVLDLLKERVFSRNDFEETRRGVCRVLQPLTRHLAGTAPRWAQDLGPWAERIASLLIRDAIGRSDLRRSLPTRLTQVNRSAGRDGLRYHQASVRAPDNPPMPHACHECGVLLNDTDRRQLYCDDCRPIRKGEIGTALLKRGRAKLRQLRAMGQDPAHSGDAGRARGTKVRRANRERALWNIDRGVADPDVFRREILPMLRRVSLTRITEATGVSAGYASFIRRGLRIPHPRLWPMLKGMAERREIRGNVRS